MLAAVLRITLLLLAAPVLACAAEPTAIATFESIGLYWSPGADPGAGGCSVRYRAAGAGDWKQGFPLWYDPRDAQCRGSLVGLSPNTQYEVRLQAGDKEASLLSRTWKEDFPIGKTITLPAGKRSEPLVITQGGSASGYVLYEAGAGGTALEVGEAHPDAIEVRAPYVIVRGFTIRGGGANGIELFPGAHDVVIEANDISGWGRYRYTNSAGWKIGMDMDAGIRASCGRSGESIERVVVQRNRIHDPRYSANSWSFGHPLGPQGITFSFCGGNHVIRWNEVTSADPQHYFNDAIGGEENFSAAGFPNRDSDVYGNVVEGSWDDGIESEGGNRNVRIWGNYLDRTGTGISSTVTHYGPLYVFRNVYNRSRKLSERPADADDRGPFAKAGEGEGFGGGRRYFFHNTLLQLPAGAGARLPLGAGEGIAGNSHEPLTNTVSRNNIWQIWKPNWSSIEQTGEGKGNDADYDLYNGEIQANRGAEAHGVRGLPAFRAGSYALSPSSPGLDAGLRLPGFNDDFRGAAPDIGAQEAGNAPLRFGIAASRRDPTQR